MKKVNPRKNKNEYQRHASHFYSLLIVMGESHRPEDNVEHDEYNDIHNLVKHGHVNEVIIGIHPSMAHLAGNIDPVCSDPARVPLRVVTKNIDFWSFLSFSVFLTVIISSNPDSRIEGT